MAETDLKGAFVAALRGIPTITDLAQRASFGADSSGRVGATPLAIVRPADTAQVQQVFRAAIANAVPLIPVSSSGGARRRGDTISDTPSVIVDLSDMNAILNVDGRDAIALIEPGVTFAQFQRALEPHGLRPYQPLQPRAEKSVLATFLEREATTVPGCHWDSTDPLAAMEIVFGEGDVFRTGSAAVPGKLEDNIKTGNRQMLGLGPVFLDFGRVVQGAQGSLGIATWASIYCQRIPKLEVPLIASSDIIEPLVELAYSLLRRRINGQLFILNGAQLALLLARDPEHLVRLRAASPQWVLYCELTAPNYFPEESIAYQRELLNADAARQGITMLTEVAGEPVSAVALRQRALSNRSSAERLGLVEQEILCVSQLDRVASLLTALDDAPAGADWAIYLQPMTHGVNAHCQFNLVAPAQPAMSLGSFSVRAANQLADSGAFFSRPYFPYAAVAFRRDPGVIPLLERTKKLLDPNGVLQAGGLALGKVA